MIIKEKLKNLVGIINKHKVKSIVVLGLTGLIAVTSLKDNVHFGAIRLYSPQGNHYAWGVWPSIEVKGENKEVKGNFYSIGLVAGANNAGNNSTITGNIASRGCFAVTPMRTRFGTNVEIGLENYVVNKEKVSRLK